MPGRPSSPGRDGGEGSRRGGPERERAMATETVGNGQAAGRDTSSFAKSLYRGEIPSELVVPYPRMARDEARRVDALIASLHDFARDSYDPRRIERERWIGDDVIVGLGERGLLGLYVDPRYGGQGLSQTGYCRVSEEFGVVDATLSVVMGVHQSIGTKGIHLFGTEEQKERFLPDLASGRMLAGFALTEPQAGSDAASVRSRAVPQADRSWVLNGEKRWIGNADKDVLVTFAGIDQGDGGGHVALILTKGMPGFSPTVRYEHMGLSGNSNWHVRFSDVRVPPENVLGQPGEGFKHAMAILNNGRMSLGTGSLGVAKHLLDLALAHVQAREQFGHPLADFELVQAKVGSMLSSLYGLESLCYLTTGLVDRGVPDTSVESAMMKVAGSELVTSVADQVFQMVGGLAYQRDQPYEKVLRDIRIFPVFEGANDVLRVFIALSGLAALGDELRAVGPFDLHDPLGAIGSLAEYVVGRVRQEVRPDSLHGLDRSLQDVADPITDQVRRLRATGEALLRRHGRDIRDRQHHLARLAEAGTDICAQVATVSRVSALG